MKRTGDSLGLGSTSVLIKEKATLKVSNRDLARVGNLVRPWYSIHLDTVRLMPTPMPMKITAPFRFQKFLGFAVQNHGDCELSVHSSTYLLQNQRRSSPLS